MFACDGGEVRTQPSGPLLVNAQLFRSAMRYFPGVATSFDDRVGAVDRKYCQMLDCPAYQATAVHSPYTHEAAIDLARFDRPIRKGDRHKSRGESQSPRSIP